MNVARALLARERRDRQVRRRECGRTGQVYIVSWLCEVRAPARPDE